jgi:hypothetical protein
MDMQCPSVLLEIKKPELSFSAFRAYLDNSGNQIKSRLKSKFTI